MFKNELANLSNFQGIQLDTDISVITLTDNISHTYCSKIKWEKNNYSPLGTAQLIMPYDKSIESYWVKYSGPVVVHAFLHLRPKSMTQAFMYNLPVKPSLNMKDIDEIEEVTDTTDPKKKQKKKKIIKKKDKKTNKIRLQNDMYNYSFIGKVSRFKQVGKTFIIYLEDLGWKFLQKVPKEFRDTFIAGQSLDNAFQAICEFMGVDFAYSIADLSKYQFSTDGYSIQKDGKVVEDTMTVLSEWKAPDDEEEDEEELTEDEKKANALKDGAPFESPGLGNYLQKKKQLEANKEKNKNALNAQVTNGNTTNDTTTPTEDTSTTPTEKILEYQEEFDDKIKDLFIGNTLYDSNISDAILNYDWITVTPTAPEPTTTTPTTIQNNPNDPNNQNNNQNNDSNNNQNNN